MTLNTDAANFDLHIEDGLWKVSYLGDKRRPSDPESALLSNTQPPSGPMWIGTATGPKGLTREEAIEIVQNIFLSRAGQSRVMTVSEFVQRKFIPVYLESRSIATRINYRSILKHIVDPKIVDRAFGTDAIREGKRIRFISGWPYLGDLQLVDVGPEAVQNLINTAIECGYSMHTVSQSAMRFA